MTLLIVAIGAGLGTMLRYLTVTFWSTKPQCLTAIFAVNMVGAFFMGILMATGATNALHHFWSTGVLGGLTTFSTMMTQSEQHATVQQLLYLLIQLVGGLIIFGLGFALATFL